ncbi:dsRBD fold-containing protein [Streptomyces sp. NPDC051020]|uniref:dsRBD fold-containing protein n=1 Tax=Streptomyces sp. NPDC051020 TaxID=3155409 RepID=UPI003426B482
MTQHTSTDKPRTKQWSVRLDLFEEGDLTKVHAVLDTGDGTLQSRTSAQRNPHDAPVPEIGDEYAAGRALIDLGNQLLRAGSRDAAPSDRAAPE